MSSNKEIEQLIEKYYNGETSLQEESRLQSFFQGEDIPGHLKVHQGWFSQLKLRSGTQWESFSEEKLFAKLPKQEETAKVVSLPERKNQLTWVYRIAAAVALILVGFYLGNQGKSTDDVEVLRAELNEVKELMISQMTSNSASGRLQAVNYSFQFSNADEETLDALIHVMNTDQNMNVRLKTVEALTRFGDQPRVRNALLDGLENEKEPAVQIALIDALVQLKEKRALDNLKNITEDGTSLKEVRDEAHLGMFKLKEI